MDEDYKPLKKLFQLRKWDWDTENEADIIKSIKVRNKDDMYLYNYADACYVDRNHPVIMRCRGIVVREDGQLLNYPFDRFFNDFEKEQSIIDWNSAQIQEKLDGSLVCVFWSKDKWIVSTRGTFYPQNNPNLKHMDNTIDFEQLFRKYFTDDQFKKLKKEYCYTFELITPSNPIITKYPKSRMGIYLIGARELSLAKEVSQLTLDHISELVDVGRPQIYEASNINMCRELFTKLKFRDDEEGLVVVDSKSNRIKIKQKSYFKLSKIIALKEQDIFEYVLGKIELDGEYLQKCDEVTEKVNEIKEHWNKIIAIAKAKHIKIINFSSDNRKEYAQQACKYPYKSLLFAMMDRKDYTKFHLKWNDVKNWIGDDDGKLRHHNTRWLYSRRRRWY